MCIARPNSGMQNPSRAVSIALERSNPRIQQPFDNSFVGRIVHGRLGLQRYEQCCIPLAIFNVEINPLFDKLSTMTQSRLLVAR